jgi:hypothetical protein
MKKYILFFFFILCFNLGFNPAALGLNYMPHNDSSEQAFLSFCHDYGFDDNEIKEALKLFWGDGWLNAFSFFYHHREQIFFEEGYKQINRNKLELESIRPRPAKNIIAVDRKLTALGILLQLFSNVPDLDPDAFEDEDD